MPNATACKLKIYQKSRLLRFASCKACQAAFYLREKNTALTHLLTGVSAPYYTKKLIQRLAAYPHFASFTPC